MKHYAKSRGQIRDIYRNSISPITLLTHFWLAPFFSQKSSELNKKGASRKVVVRNSEQLHQMAKRDVERRV